MSGARPFRFGVMTSGRPDGAEWVALARKVEDLGFATLVMPDHPAMAALAPWPALAVAAAVTTSLHVGTMVSAIDFYGPVVLAREASTLHTLSGGRVELGVGAGWLAADYELLGSSMDGAGARLERLDAGVARMRRYWDDPPASAELPAPAGRPRLLLGGGGRRMLTLAARHADVVGLAADMRTGALGPESAASSTEESTRRKVAWVREAAGERFDALELHVLVNFVRVTGHAGEVAAKVARVYGVDDAAAARIPHVLIGGHRDMADELLRRRDDLGISYITVPAAAVDDMAPVVAELAGR